MKVLLILSVLFLSSHGAEVFVHMLAWFESKDTNNGTWGSYWTMANKDPDNLVDGMNDIASFYHPIIGPYASSDPDVIDWQLGTMKLAGISGVFIAWSGTYDYSDYVQILKNSEAIIEGTERAGLKFAIVYEDINLILEGVNDQVAQATLDMQYVQNNYISKENYLQINEKPVVLDFGPQILYDETWDQVLEPIDPKPAFLTLWNQHLQGGTYCEGEYGWVAVDFLDGLNEWYGRLNVDIKMGVAYPGFQPFYQSGGWVGPAWTIDYSPNTFQQTLDLALEHTDIIQICTWNDYSEGTVIEPTDEYNTTFVEIIQEALGSKYSREDFNTMTEIFLKRKGSEDGTVLQNLEKQYHDLVHKFD